MTERAAGEPAEGEAMTEAKRQEADAGLMGKASIDWDDGLPWRAGLADQPCQTTRIPCEYVRSGGEAHRPMRVSRHRGAGASRAAGTPGLSASKPFRQVEIGALELLVLVLEQGHR